MSDQAVLTARQGGILRVTINRPERLNALNRDVYTGIMAALDAAETDASCRVLVLTGAGRAFCAGQDLSAEVYSKTGPQPDLGIVLDRYNEMILRMRRLGRPIIGAVNGVAAGGGAGVALACDIVLAKRSATFMQAFARIGLIPDCGSTWVLPRLIGDARARGHAMLAEPIKAEQAEAWGMIWKAVDDDEFEAEVTAMAGRLAAAPTHSIGLQKQAFLASLDNDLGSQLALEKKLQIESGKTPDYAEGVAAFLDKRAAKFTGAKG